MSGDHRALTSASEARGTVWDGRMSRRSFLGWSAAAAAGMAASHLFLLPGPRGRVALNWVTAQETLDDYPIWVAQSRGYLDRLGIDLSVSLVGQSPAIDTVRHRAINFSSPAEVVTAVDRGLSTTSVFQLSAGSVFGFAFRDSRKRASDLDGATVAIGDETWRAILDPLLVEARVNPVGVRTVIAGSRWLDAVRTGDADAAVSWRGLDLGPTGRGLVHRVGDRWSRFPANSYVVESLPTLTPAEESGLQRFLQATVMALDFAAANPRAAAQIAYRSAPGLSAELSPQAAVDRVLIASSIYGAGKARGLAWGFHESDRWTRYLNAAQKAGLIKSAPAIDVYTNRFVAAANAVDTTPATLDATTFPLVSDFKNTTVPKGGLVDA